MTRRWLVLMVLAMGGVASAAPGAPAGSTVRDARPAPVPPDGANLRSVPPGGDRRRMVALLEVRVEGLSDDVKESFRRQLEEQIDTKRYRFADRTFMKSAMMRSTKWTDGCVVGRCLAEIRAHAGAELVLLAALTGSGTSFGYVVTLIRTDTGRVVEQESDRCDVCTVAEVMGRATLGAVEVLNNVPDKLPDEAADQLAAMDRAVGKVKDELAARDRRDNRIGITLLAIGLAGAIAGGALYMTNDDRPSYAVATAVGGLGLATGGLVVLEF